MARVFGLALALGGTLSGEHGIGLTKRDFMPQAVDAATLALMRQLKAVFDPDGILNPGKLLPP
jgi:D-lactate dehydrogenase